jgi:phosphatidylserine decarboxylase
MKVHREGIRIILQLSVAVLLIIFLVNIFSPHQTIFHILLYLAGVLFITSVVYFFRKMDRKGSDDPSAVLSAADGKVLRIVEVFEDEYFKDQRIVISVFMSVLDMHVNLYPVKGRIVYDRYHPGKFFLAFHPKSSKLNEHHSVVIQTSSGIQILLRQIAGGLARRIISTAKQGDEVEKGQELGIIKFGSRLDMFLPPGCSLEVSTGQHVRCGETIVAMLPDSSEN